MAYSKSTAAKSLGISGGELEKRAKAAGYKTTEAYYAATGGAAGPLIDSISKQMIEYDRQLEELTPYLSLTDQEKQAFLDKAVEQITPYYNRKTAEINAGLAEGKLQTAEDILTSTRKIDEETKAQLADFDLSQAQTEEEFLNKIGQLTTNKGEDIAAKTMDYKQRMETLKANQIQQGTLTSGVGAKARAEQDTLKGMELGQIQSRYGLDTTAAETSKKYTLDSISLARKAAEDARVRAIGTPDQIAQTQQDSMQAAGITDMSQLKSPTELARQRAERGITPLDPTSGQNANLLTELGAEKTKAGIATQQELQADELARRNVEYGSQRDKILAEQAKKAAQIKSLRGY